MFHSQNQVYPAANFFPGHITPLELQSLVQAGCGSCEERCSGVDATLGHGSSHRFPRTGCVWDTGALKDGSEHLMGDVTLVAARGLAAGGTAISAMRPPGQELPAAVGAYSKAFER